MVDTVCVTGASGFIAAHIVRDLLEKGYQVRGTVRSSVEDEKYTYLRALPGANKRLKLFQSDLLIKGSFDEALAGSDTLMHVASPFFINSENPQEDLITPALTGTLIVLHAAKKVDTIKRVVFTSSVVAVTDKGAVGKLFTEADWNTEATLERDPYPLSKVRAEKAAWDFIKSERPNFDLISINPGAVIGPSLGPRVNTSPALIRDLLLGEYPIIMNLTTGYVDVRDVAIAHRLAMEIPEASGRYICNNESLSMQELVELLKGEGFGNDKLPGINMTSSFGSLFVKLFSYSQPSWLGNFISLHIDNPLFLDNSKIKKDLGLNFLPLEQSVRDTVESFISLGHVESFHT